MAKVDCFKLNPKFGQCNKITLVPVSAVPAIEVDLHADDREVVGFINSSWVGNADGIWEEVGGGSHRGLDYGRLVLYSQEVEDVEDPELPTAFKGATPLHTTSETGHALVPSLGKPWVQQI